MADMTMDGAAVAKPKEEAMPVSRIVAFFFTTKRQG